MDSGTSGKDNVILLPRTIDYYQEELTKMLETERFAEAMRLLSFLLECRSDDPKTVEEWRMLLDWLRATFPALAEESDGTEEEELTEQDLYRQRIHSRMAEDPAYVKKLLETLLSHPDLEKKMLALEQLAIADHPHINDTLIRWLQQVDLHPLVQYKVLQTLKARGASGKVELQRAGESVELEIADTPLDMIHYSDPIQSVMDHVREVCEIRYPNLAFFADHMWKEFLAFTYGTSLFRTLDGMDEQDAVLWAAALHSAVVDAMSGGAPEEDILEQYNLPETDRPRFAHHREQIASFIRHTFLP